MYHINMLVSFGLYQNCQYLRIKIATMNRFVANFVSVFISLSETWFTDDIFSNELGLFS